MCLLTYFLPGVQPDTDALALGAEWNSDGHGYAIVVGDRIVTRKSMVPNDLIDEFESMRRKHPDGPALFHSRIGTAGTVGKENCHPFQVGNDPRTVVAHNGIMPESMQPAKGDPRCDTRIFAEKHLPYRNLNSAKSRRKLGKWLGTDKVVVLSVNPAHRESSWLINGRHGIWDNESGVWYSNSSYNGRGFCTYGYGASYAYQHSGFRCWSHKHGIHIHYVAYAQANCEGCYPVEDVPDDAYDDAWWSPPRATVASTEHVPGTEVELATRLGDECIACGTIGHISGVTMICTICLTCNDCGGVIDGGPMSEQDSPCTCYVPGRLLHVTNEPGQDAVTHPFSNNTRTEM